MNSQNLMDRPAHRIASILAVSALALGLAACGKTEEPTVGQRLDSAVEKTEQAAADARVKAESAMKSAETKMEQGAANAEATAKDAANTAKGAIDDATITAQVNAGLAKDPDLSALKIKFADLHITYSGGNALIDTPLHDTILLTGVTTLTAVDFIF